MASPRSGRYCMQRGWMDHSFFPDSPYSPREAWLWLIENAAWKPRTVNDGVAPVEIERGELCVSVRFVAASWQWSKSAVDRFLGQLTKEGMISRGKKSGQIAGRSTAIITVCKYDDYQFASVDERDANRDAKRDTSGTPSGTHPGTNQIRIKNLRRKEPEESGESLPQTPSLLDAVEDVSPGRPIASTPAANELAEDFDEWWQQVPKKVGKAQAERAYRTARKIADHSVLLQGIMRYGADRAGQDPQFTKHPSTWLNGNCWLDDQNVVPFRPAGPGGTSGNSSRDAFRELMAEIEEDRRVNT